MLPEPGAKIVRGGKRRYARFGVHGVLLCIILLYSLAVAIDPWATHIGGTWTPLLYWSGSGNLVTSSGNYRFFVFLYPSPNHSIPPYLGHQPTGGIEGWGYVCTSRSRKQSLDLRGTIDDGWQNLEGKEIHFYFNETQVLNVGQTRGGFTLHGEWHGPELVMKSDGESGSTFSSGLKIEPLSVTLARGSYSDFKQMCAHTPELP